MTEKQLIEKLNKLSEIKPNKQWVDLTKKSILDTDFTNVSASDKITIKARFVGFVNILSSFNYKTKFAYSLAGVLLAGGVFGFAQSAVPGEALFSVRRATEKFQTVFKTNNDAYKYDFEIANKRLEDLALIVKDNRTENIAVATNEFKASMLDATNKLITSVKKNSKSIKEVAIEIKKIRDNTVLLDKIGGSDLTATSDNLYKKIVEEEIKSLEDSTLTKEQETSLIEIKELFKAEKYLEAFEKILVISN